MSNEPVYWDPFHMDAKDPYPMLKRLRDEAPIYYNEKWDFYAVSRYEDCEAGLLDRDTFSSAKGSTIDVIKADIQIPSGMFIFTDAPVHTIFRQFFARMFTPKRLKALEPQVREYTQRALDPLVGAEKIDFVKNLGAEMPMQVIGMLLGIPEADRQKFREKTDAGMRNDTGEPKPVTPEGMIGYMFDEYITWRTKHPSDDLMTELLNVEFEDETGAVRKMTRTEILVVCNLLSSAGNETTNKLISWSGKILGEHPDARRQINADRSLIPQTIEEVLRYESMAPHLARVALRDVEYYGVKVPKGSAVAFITHAANRDERVFENPDTFDIHRERKPHLTFGYAWHVCLGNPLARLEGRIALEEILDRFPDWEVDYANAKMIPSSSVRGYETLPAFVH